VWCKKKLLFITRKRKKRGKVKVKEKSVGNGNSNSINTLKALYCFVEWKIILSASILLGRSVVL